MRALSFVVIVAALAGALSLGVWSYLEQPPPRSRKAFVASTKPTIPVIPTTADVVATVSLAPELGTRPGVDWSVFLGPTGDGKSPEKGVKPWPANGPRVVWTCDLGEGYSPPTVCRGRLLVADNIKKMVHLYCLHSETGERLWEYKYVCEYDDKYGYPPAPRACPVTDGWRVYLYASDGVLHCLRLADGKPLWKLDTVPTFGVVPNFFGVASAPVIDGDRLLLQVGGSPEGSSDRDFMNLRGNGSCIVALDKATGKELYRCGDDLASYSTPIVVNLQGKKTGLVFARGGLLGFDPDEGKELFHLPFRSRILESVNASNPVFQGTRVFLSEAYGAGCVLVDLKDRKPEIVWASPTRRKETGLGSHWCTPLLIDGHLYGCAGRHTNEAELRCVDFATGKVRWRTQPTFDDTVAGRGSLAYVDGYLFYVCEEGILFLIKPDAGKYHQVSAWDGRAKIPDHPYGHSYLHNPCWAAPVISHGLLYLRSQDRLVCLEVIPSET